MDTVTVLLFSVLLFGILGLFLIRGLNNRTITGLERQSTITHMGNNFVSDGHMVISAKRAAPLVKKKQYLAQWKKEADKRHKFGIKTKQRNIIGMEAQL